MSLKEKLLTFIETDKLTTEELAYRLYGDADVFSKSKTLSVISSLRKDGIDLFPDDGIWKLPETRVEYKKFINHKRKCHFAGFARMVNAGIEGANRYKTLAEDRDELLGEVQKALKGNYQNGVLSSKKTKTRHLTA